MDRMDKEGAVFLVLLALLFGCAVGCPLPNDGDPTWAHIAPPAGSPYIGCAERPGKSHGGVVCWLPAETCVKPDGVVEAP